MHRILRNSLIVAVLMLALATTAVRSTKPHPKPLPNPNGFDDFLNASRLITGDVFAAATNTHAAFGEFIQANAEPLRLVRVGNSRECQVPIDPSSTNLSVMLNNLAGLKRLGQLLKAEGQFAEDESRLTDAVQSYVCCIRYGEQISRDGLIINRLVGVACESLGYDPLIKLVPKLNCEQSRLVFNELEKIESNGVTWKEISKSEHLYFSTELQQTINPVKWFMAWRISRSGRERAEEKHNRANARLRLLTAELALRCYQADQGHPPEKLDQLVPKYLQRVPEDPFSHQPLHYQRVDDTRWLVYSLGIDRIDDGGKPVSRTLSSGPQRGDLFYDSPY